MTVGTRLVRHCVFMVVTVLSLVFLLGATPQQQPPSPPAPPQQVEPPEPQSGEGINLSFRVVDAVTGKGLGSVKIDVTRKPTLQDRRLWSYTKTTDALGDATISNMVAATYSVVPTISGYMLANATGETVALSTGRKPAPVTFRMWRSSSMDGVIQDQDKNPVANAIVDVLQESWIGGLRTLAVAQPSVTADKDGKFAFPNVMSGTYYLRAIPPRGVVQQQLRASPAGKQAAFVDTLYPGVLYLEEAAPVKFDAGVNLYDMRIEMQKSPYYSFSGRVTGIPPEVRGSALVLIRRAAFDSPFPFTWANPYAGGLATSIAADGTFAAPSVPPGPYWAGYTPAGVVRGGTQFLVADRNLEDVRIEVTPGINLVGKVVFDDGGLPEPRAGRLSVFLANMGVYVRDFAVLPNGEFNASGLPAGPYRVEFPGSAVVRRVEVNRRMFSGGQFELTPLDPTAVITIGREGGAIQGAVEVLDQAKAYPRGMVTVAPLPLRPTDTPRRAYLEGKSSFSVEHLEAGRYRVCAWLEEGSDVDRFLGNPQYEQKFGVLCESINLAADEKRAVQLKQITVAEFK